MTEENLNRYQRQIINPRIGEEGQKRIGSSRVAILGCGALGSTVASHLARAGVGFLRLVDRDFVEMSNLQRQVLFDEEDVRGNLPKAIAAKRKLAKINSTIRIEAHIANIYRGNIEELIGGVDLILDGMDNFETRFLINEACVKNGRPWIYAGCIASHGLVMTVIPGKTPCLRCVFESGPPPEFSPTCDTAGIFGPAVGVTAALEAMEAIKFLSGNEWSLDKSLYRYDAWTREVQSIKVELLHEKINCPVCRQGIYEYLHGEKGSRAALMCGRSAVQIQREDPLAVDLGALAEKLRNAGEVEQNEYLLKFRTGQYEISVFQDGRAIVHGTRDISIARSIYTKYIGA